MAHLGQRILCGILVLGSLATPLGAQGSRGARDAADVRVDYASTRREIQNFEAVLGKVINSAFSNASFALGQKVRGVYLQGYGVAFSFLVNIHRAMISTPFGDIRKGEEVTPEQKKKRIEDLKEKLIRALLDNGENCRHLRQEDAVTIVAFFEDRNFPDEENQNKTVVLSILKRDLDEASHREDRFREFKQRVKIVEY